MEWPCRKEGKVTEIQHQRQGDDEQKKGNGTPVCGDGLLKRRSRWNGEADKDAVQVQSRPHGRGGEEVMSFSLRP